MNKEITKRRDIMKKGILKSILIIELLLIAGTVFALSGLLPKLNENKKKSTEQQQVVKAEKKAETAEGLVTKEIVIDDIEKMNVPVYEYVEKVIIEGELKWISDKTYEFGKDFKERAGGEATITTPSSLAVDSKGNIYILDTINNRIQKYNTDGKYITSIRVDGFRPHIPPGYTMEKWKTIREETPMDTIPPVRGDVLGINIVIDSKDNLYYYLIRTKDNKKTGEVWKFVNDEVVGEWEVPVQKARYYEAPQGLVLEDDGNIWIFITKKGEKGQDKHFEIKTKKSYTLKERKEYKEKIKKEKIPKIVSFNHERGEVVINKGKSTVEINLKNNTGKKNYSVISTKESFFIKRKEIIEEKNNPFLYEYDYKGNLKRIIQGEKFPKKMLRKAWMEIDKETGAIKIYKYELKRKLMISGK